MNGKTPENTILKIITFIEIEKKQWDLIIPHQWMIKIACNRVWIFEYHMHVNMNIINGNIPLMRFVQLCFDFVGLKWEIVYF